MAHYAELDGNDVVVNVIKFDDADMLDADGNESEAAGIEHLKSAFGHDRWVQTSYNTREGEHTDGGTPLRYRYASIGGTYDRERDAFLYPKPQDDATLDEETLLWVIPSAE